MLTKRSTLIILALLLAPFVLTGCSSDNTTSPIIETPDTVPPAAPVLGTPRTADGWASVRWQKNTEADIAGYYVYEYDPSPDRETSYQRLNTQLVAANSYKVEGLTTGATYYFKISAVDQSANESAPSAALAITVSPTSAGKDDTIKSDYLE
ncbi:MAG: fibronectin type III domain-containing protein [Candidatus Eisenbacteria bacterium]|nr:fibronectin type III domain-containing protein [Candidatus Eisenbacteria bacterium]